MSAPTTLMYLVLAYLPVSCLAVTVPPLDMSAPSQSGLSGLTSKASNVLLFLIPSIHLCPGESSHLHLCHLQLSLLSSQRSCLYTTTIWNTLVHSSSKETTGTFLHLFQLACTRLHLFSSTAVDPKYFRSFTFLSSDPCNFIIPPGSLSFIRHVLSCFG